MQAGPALSLGVVFIWHGPSLGTVADPGKHLVLVVDDDEDVRRSLAQMFEEEVDGVAVHVASRATEALERLEEHVYDLIISDYLMPGTDGLAFLEKARQVQPDVPAVLLTAFPDPLLAARAAQQVGIVIAKPLDLDYLVAIVQAASVGRIRRPPS